MHKYMVRVGSRYLSWSYQPVDNPLYAQKFTVEQLVKDRRISAAVRSGKAVIVEV